MSTHKGRNRSTPLQILIHLFMAPKSGGSFSWEMASDQMNRLAEDLRWNVLRKIYIELNGRSPYAAHLQKHSIKVENLNVEFFREILEVIRDRQAASFHLRSARELTDLEILENYFIPVILEWAVSERSVSVSQELTPSFEDLITCEDSSGNVYQRFPDEMSWILHKYDPGYAASEERELPREMAQFVNEIAAALTASLRKLMDSGKYDKYILLMSRLEDDVCTWKMTFNYLRKLGVRRYSSWKSLSVVSNRAVKEFVDDLPNDVRVALHQDDESLSASEKTDRLRMAVMAAIELEPMPSPMELIAEIA